MIFQVNYSAEARLDLKDIYEYIAYELLAPEAAAGQTRRIMKAIRSLEQMPERHKLYEEEPWHSRGLRVFPVDNYLLDQWLTESGAYAFTSRLSMAELKTLAGCLAIFHDYGKSSMLFQAKISESCEVLKNSLENSALFVLPKDDVMLRDSNKMPHGVAGEILLLLKACKPSIAAIVGAHHGKPWEQGAEIRLQIEELLEDDGFSEVVRQFQYSPLLWGKKANRNTWIETQDEFYEWALSVVGITQVSQLPDISESDAVILAGLVVMADWLSSNEEHFPLIEYHGASCVDIEQRAKVGISKINLPACWHPKCDRDFEKMTMDRFGFLPNSIQVEIMKTVAESEQPGLVILEAPMGMGKTEAALLAAEEFSENRVFGLFTEWQP
ncbi:MAG: CRISPR-associated endonuclease Cas3'' [Lachnospiraceae bacterium]|nr:CRISPR-associated endonuclease Cas3'' [Lachnospiraceae bacterium]